VGWNSEQLRPLVLDEAHAGTVDVDDAAPLVEQHHRVARLLERLPEQ
jgi:hypothetical protein